MNTKQSQAEARDNCPRCGLLAKNVAPNGWCLCENAHTWQLQSFVVRDERCEAALDAHILGMTAGEIWAYRQGWNEAHAGVQFAQGQWKEIRSAEDLPKESGEYFVMLDLGGGIFKADTELLNVQDDADIEDWVNIILAWMPIPPYQQPEVKTDV